MIQQLDLLGIAVADDGMQRRLQEASAKTRDTRKRQAMALVDVPRARNTDPDTSHGAAKRVLVTGQLNQQQTTVCRLVRLHPGLTSAELAQKHAHSVGRTWEQCRPMIARRLPELDMLHVKRGPVRVCKVTGSPCITWEPM